MVRLWVLQYQWRDQYQDYELYSLSDETDTETKNIGLKFKTETEANTEC